jgi:hypothetical protein
MPKTMVALSGVEPLAFRFGNERSVRMSYRAEMANLERLELPASSFVAKRSNPTELQVLKLGRDGRA